MVRLFWCRVGNTNDQISMNWVVAQVWRIRIALEVEEQENCFSWSLRTGIEIKAFVRSVAAQARMALWHLLQQLPLEPQLDWVCDPPVTCLRIATLWGAPRVSSVVSHWQTGLGISFPPLIKEKDGSERWKKSSKPSHYCSGALP